MLGAIDGPVHHQQSRNIAVVKLRNHLFADDPGSKNQRRALLPFAKDALGEFYARGRDRHRPGTKFSLRANPLANFQRALEQPV